jgi:hypothetical protein
VVSVFHFARLPGGAQRDRGARRILVPAGLDPALLDELGRVEVGPPFLAPLRFP